MSTEQATELLSILRDLHGLTGAVLAGVGLLIGIALWFIMFHSTSRSGFWGGVVLLGFLFSSTGASAEWTYTQYKNAIDSQSSGNVDYPSKSQWTAYKNLGLSPQAHWESWWNNGNPPMPYQFNTYTNKLVSDTAALLVSHDLWGQWGNPIANELGPLAVPTFAQWAAWGGTDAQKLTFWHDWWGYWELHNPPSSQFITDFVAAGSAGQYVFQAPGGGGGGGNGSVTYNLWGQWSSLIAPELGILEVPTFEQWVAWGGTDAQKLTYWQDWWGHWELRNPPAGKFITDFVSAGVAGQYVFIPPPVVPAEYVTFSSLVQSLGMTVPSLTDWQTFTGSGGDASEFARRYHLLHYGSTSGFPAEFSSVASSGPPWPSITGSSSYVSLAQSVVTDGRTPPLPAEVAAYEAYGFSASDFYDLWKSQSPPSGVTAFSLAFSANLVSADAVVPNSSFDTCCPPLNHQPAAGFFWEGSHVDDHQKLTFSVSVECGACPTISGTGRFKCRYYSNGGGVYQAVTDWKPTTWQSVGCGPQGNGLMGCPTLGCGTFAFGTLGNVLPTCTEAYFLSVPGCSQVFDCRGLSFDCRLCQLVSDLCLDCSACGSGPPDPECDTSVDGDCDGCPDSQEPCENPPPCSGDVDCDDCPDDRDSSPRVAGGTCDPETPPECEGDEDCDGCPDDQENRASGEFSENPACQCDTTPGDEDNDDHDCDGCPEDWDGETRTRKNQDCGPCKDKGGDSDRDGCCDDDDTSPNDSGDEEKCEDCTQDVIQKVEELSQRIADKWLPAFSVGETQNITATVNLRGITGARTQWRVDFSTGLVEGTFVDPGIMETASASLLQSLELGRQLMAYVIYVLGFLCCWYIVNSLGGGNA